MTATPDSQRQVVIARETDGSNDIRGARASDNQGGAAVDHPIPDVACGVEFIVAGSQYTAAHALREAVNTLFDGHGQPLTRLTMLSAAALLGAARAATAHHAVSIRVAESVHQLLAHRTMRLGIASCGARREMPLG
jgi:hypothetical protein